MTSTSLRKQKSDNQLSFAFRKQRNDNLDSFFRKSRKCWPWIFFFFKKVKKVMILNFTLEDAKSDDFNFSFKRKQKIYDLDLFLKRNKKWWPWSFFCQKTKRWFPWSIFLKESKKCDDPDHFFLLRKQKGEP